MAVDRSTDPPAEGDGPRFEWGPPRTDRESPRQEKGNAGCGKGLLGCAAAVLLLLVAAVAALLIAWEVGWLVPLGTVDGDELRDADRAVIEGLVELEPGEEILLFYSTEMFDSALEGNVLTSLRLLSWEANGDEPWQAQAWIDDVTGLAFEPAASPLEFALLEVTDHEGSFYLSLDDDRLGRRRFLSRVEELCELPVDGWPGSGAR